MSEPIPYFTLPDDWAAKARCPVCNYSHLIVVHHAEVPDQMTCLRCHSIFEIEEKGPRIHFISLPKVLISLLNGQWVTYAEMKQTVQEVAARQVAEKKTASAAEALLGEQSEVHLAEQPEAQPGERPSEQPGAKAPEPPPFSVEMVKAAGVPTPAEPEAEKPVEEVPVPAEPSPFTADMVETSVPPAPGGELPAAETPAPVYQARAPEIKDVRTRAKDLYKLGNRPDQIKAILFRDPLLDKAEVQSVVDGLYGQEDSKRRRQRTLVWVSIGAGLLILIVCVVFATTWRSILGILPEGAGVDYMATIAANKTIVPMLATPIVVLERDNGAPRPSCPRTKEEAATVYGAPADNWFSDIQDGSWFLVSRTPVNVFVPGGMSGVLVNISGGGVDTVAGPASIRNVTSISILCR